MSWPGENDPPTSGGSSGRGRRRRSDSPPEDPYPASQNSTGTGRRGSGEYERPAEYVAQAEQEAAAYDQIRGYRSGLLPDGYRQQQGTQPGSTSGAVSTEQYQRISTSRIRTSRAGTSSTRRRILTRRSRTDTRNAAYPEAQDQYRNLDSSGFYQPLTNPRHRKRRSSRRTNTTRTVRLRLSQPSFYEQPASYEQPPPTSSRALSRTSAFPTMPEPVAGFVPDPEPSPVAQSYVTAGARRHHRGRSGRQTPTTPAGPGSDGELTNWLQFVGTDDRRAERARRRRIQLISLAAVLVLLAVGGGRGSCSAAAAVRRPPRPRCCSRSRTPTATRSATSCWSRTRTRSRARADPSGRGAAVLIPSELSVESAALDSQPFGGSMPSAAPAGKDALTTLLGVDVDGVWSMDELTFAALLNNLIGVTVDRGPGLGRRGARRHQRQADLPGRLAGHDRRQGRLLRRSTGPRASRRTSSWPGSAQVVQGMLAQDPAPGEHHHRGAGQPGRGPGPGAAQRQAGRRS